VEFDLLGFHKYHLNKVALFSLLNWPEKLGWAHRMFALTRIDADALPGCPSPLVLGSVRSVSQWVLDPAKITPDPIQLF
jgi:hypothetical protein